MQTEAPDVEQRHRSMRAVIDWYLEKLGDRRTGPAGPEVEDIPLD